MLKVPFIFFLHVYLSWRYSGDDLVKSRCGGVLISEGLAVVLFNHKPKRKHETAFFCCFRRTSVTWLPSLTTFTVWMKCGSSTTGPTQSPRPVSTLAWAPPSASRCLSPGLCSLHSWLSSTSGSLCPSSSCASIFFGVRCILSYRAWSIAYNHPSGYWSGESRWGKSFSVKPLAETRLTQSGCVVKTHKSTTICSVCLLQHSKFISLWCNMELMELLDVAIVLEDLNFH